MGFFSGAPFCRRGDLTLGEWGSDFAADLFPLYSNLTELILVDPTICFYYPGFEGEDRQKIIKYRVGVMQQALKATREAAAAMEVSDDISSHSLPTRLASDAALPLCSGATHPRLTLYSGCSVTFLLFLLGTNHSLLIIRFCRVKVVNSTRLCLRIFKLLFL
jgi:hypothetical protein